MPGLTDKIIFMLFVLLGLNNLLFGIISSYTGPIWGFVGAVLVCVHWHRRRNIKFIIVVIIIWFVIHLVELLTTGAGPYPMLFYPNLGIPVFLLILVKSLDFS